jgi:hypothetical protein
MTGQDIEELRNFIQVGITQEFAHPGDPGIVLRSLPRIRLAIYIHGTELQAGEGTAKEPYALLHEKHRPPGIEPDEQP